MDHFKALCVDLNLTQLTLKPTHMKIRNPEKPTLIDIILTITPQKYTFSGILSQDISDRCPIVSVRNTKIKQIWLQF